MPEIFSQPIIPEPPSELDVLRRHQLSYDFRDEVNYRDEFQRYCQWYYQTAAQHQHELRQMRKDLRLLRLFYRARSS